MKFKFNTNKNVVAVIFIILSIAVVVLLCPEVLYSQEDEWQLSIEKELSDIKGNLSGLTWNSDSKTLFAVTDHPSSIIELDRDGNVLRVIPVSEDLDFEAIEYIGHSLYTLSLERQRKLATYLINDTTSLLPPPLYSHTLRINSQSDNAGFEGLAWNVDTSNMMIAQEKKPLQLYTLKQTKNDITVSDELTNLVDLPWFLKDISGLHYDKIRQQLYILSHESSLVLISDMRGRKKIMSLRKGYYGLHSDIPQAEGITSDNGDNLWIVSEPKIFYRFNRKLLF